MELVGKKVIEEELKPLVNSLYNDRVNYTIVALTGYVGTGCSQLAELMSKKFEEWTDLRSPKDLFIPEAETTDNEEMMYRGISNHKSIGSVIFARKYTLCHDYMRNYEPFTVLKYSHALLFFSIRHIISECIANSKDKESDFKNCIKKILSDKYRPSHHADDDEYREKRNIKPENRNFTFESEHRGNYEWEKAHALDGFEFNDWNDIISEFESIHTHEGIDLRKQSDLFFDEKSAFNKFVKVLNGYLWKLDAYCLNFFYHRLGYTLRAVADPLYEAGKVYDSKKVYGGHIYCVVELINQLIKGARKKDENGKSKPCRFVIDKIRNSLEAKFLKERYSAFYFVATHEEKSVRLHMKSRIQRIYDEEELIRKNQGLIDLQINKILRLDAIERKSKDFEKGKFFAHNLSQCMADAEIHISNEDGIGTDKPFFYSMSEQWMKYATLIQHPGLITPSSEERCMVVAYTAKFNSGCISRQVGAVITNKSHTIRTIGWNDVPYGQVPCSLRELFVMATGEGDDLKLRDKIYSEYEISDVKRFDDGETFNEKVRKKYRNLHLGMPENELMDGMPCSYCFKTLQNEFEEEKNQVHIRSLHAEENAILQMAKYGGEALHEGIIYVTASPCELCCKKLYQIGVRKIVYIDEYPGISRQNIIANGYNRPRLKQFQGAYGPTYFKLYQPIIAYKEELAIRMGDIISKD